MSSMRRCKNYTEFEKLRILEIVERYKEIIESKCSEGITPFAKEKAWLRIATEFNKSVDCDQKSVYQLRTLYKNLKRRVDPEVFKLINARRRNSEGNDGSSASSDVFASSEFRYEDDEDYDDDTKPIIQKCKEEPVAHERKIKLRILTTMRTSDGVARQKQVEACPEPPPRPEDRVLSIMEAIITETKTDNEQPQYNILNGCVQEMMYFRPMRQLVPEALAEGSKPKRPGRHPMYVPHILFLRPTQYFCKPILHSLPLQERLQSAPPGKQLPTILPKIALGPASASKQPTQQQGGQGNAAAPQTLAADQEKDPDEVCLRWNSHHSNMKTTFPTLLEKEQYVDVTLSSEGQTIRCHRLILSSCSAYFDEVLSGITPLQHPVIFLKGIPFWILKSLIDFMYVGEVHIEQAKLQEILEVAEILKIKGLTGKAPSQTAETKKEDIKPQPSQSQEPSPAPPPIVLAPKPQRAVPPLRLAVTKEQAASLQTVDPLSLLKPSFYEENVTSQPVSKRSPQPVRQKLNQSLAEFSAKQKDWLSKKIAPKKKLKRKSTDHDPSPPPIILRKGTKSRPIVKAPKYYHMEYEEKDADREVKIEDCTDDGETGEEQAAQELPPPPSLAPATEMTFDISNVKSEPIDMDIEENDVNFEGFQPSTTSIRYGDEPAPEVDEPEPESTAVNSLEESGEVNERVDAEPEEAEDERAEIPTEEVTVEEGEEDQDEEPPGKAPDENIDAGV